MDIYEEARFAAGYVRGVAARRRSCKAKVCAISLGFVPGLVGETECGAARIATSRGELTCCAISL
jgi:hypothetical protein